MKIFVDENIPTMTVDALRLMGHDVMDIRGTEKEGLNDGGVWEIAQQNERLLISAKGKLPSFFFKILDFFIPV
jgi:predicted nuclease of predicted toxin-antitoxin system